MIGRLSELHGELNKYNEGREVTSHTLATENSNRTQQSNAMGSTANFFHPAYQIENSSDERRTTFDESLNSREGTRKSSLASTHDEASKARVRIAVEKAGNVLLRLFIPKRMQQLQYSFSRLQLYYRQAQLKISRVSKRIEKHNNFT